ncbi:MAG: hypothetical protein GX542_06590 [Rhodococcus sp.]|nr:hypothetical protein [Rhodococcus sp. (in: high G+C Gram-positive bacteria)]
MISAAFAAGASRVRLRADERNVRSAAAILKIPGVVEDVPRLDSVWLRSDGTQRTSRFFWIERPHVAVA